MKSMTIQQEQTKKIKKGKGFSTRQFRFWAQLGSFAIIVWIGYEFVRFVSFVERGGQIGPAPTRPPGVEGFLPISGLISFRDWLMSGHVNLIHPASLIILLAAVITAWLFKKGFCSWVCPVGFISEMVGNIGDKLFKHRLKLPKWLDYPLRGLKYLLLAFFLYAVFYAMSPDQVREFVASPYNKVADIKMLKFFTEIDVFALWTIGGLFVLSIILRGFWCRYLCPYGGLLGLFSLAAPTKIRRDENLCINCTRCAKVCPSFIKVDKVITVVSDECSGCLDCVDVCPVDGALDLKVIGRKKRVSKKIWAYAFVVAFWGTLLAFKLLGPWQNNITTQEYIYHTERMNGAEYNHPGR